MSFDYDKLKIKSASKEGEQWASYSDLFMVLSIVFLLLYVVSSVRTGTSNLMSQIQYNELEQKKLNLEQQVKVYESIKDEYLQTGATPEEKMVYKDLMRRMDLLRSQTQRKRDQLNAKLDAENQRYEELNRYQHEVLSIINANMLVKARLNKRKQKVQAAQAELKEKQLIMANQSDVINFQQKQLMDKKHQIADKSQALSKFNTQVEQLQKELKIKTDALDQTHQREQSLRLKLSKTGEELSQLKQKQATLNQVVESQVKNAWKVADQRMQNYRAVAGAKEQELSQAKQDLEQKLAQNEQEKKQQADSLIDKIQAKENAIKLTEMQKAQVENKYQKDMQELSQKSEQEKKRIQAKLDWYVKLSEKDRAKYAASIEELKLQAEKDKAEFESKLKAATAGLQAGDSIGTKKQKIAGFIKANFKKAGIPVTIDQKTGDVILTFGNEYFDTGKYFLKQGMKNILQKFVPLYAKSLFGDPKVAKEVTSVEIVGFASPTFNKRYVDPKSMHPKHRKAIAYNLDLSYNRAKSIFKYIFDQQKMRYDHQGQLRSLIKVTGRSFLAEETKGRKIASGMHWTTYCKQFNCKKSQRVIIKFDVLD